MDLIHNVAFRILTGAQEGIYRVVLDEQSIGMTIVCRIDSSEEHRASRGGRKQLNQTKNPRKKPKPRLIGSLIWVERGQLLEMKEARRLVIVDLEPEPNYLPLSATDTRLFAERVQIASLFLDVRRLQESLLVHRAIAPLIREASKQSGSSESRCWTVFSLLCRFGFSEQSVRPTRALKSGARGIRRPCDEGGYKKAGRKTSAQRIVRATEGFVPDPKQPGMSSEWRALILAADAKIPAPKPPMSQRCTSILESAFVRRYRQIDSELVPVDPIEGQYPNRRQIRRVLEIEVPRLTRLLQKTTQGHFNRSHRGLTSCNWKGVGGPGHTWAIDSTIGDIYLRSSINRAWIVGRPIVYIIVDVWSTAVVGFYVCLNGPSWETAKLALFSAMAPKLVSQLWGYQMVDCLNPLPSMCYSLLCDRGEYLSQAARFTASKLILDMSYTPPYRPDLKGLVEVLHRIKKDHQYFFIPGAIDHRRKEYELRRYNAEEAIFTVQEYVQYLYNIFTEYNLTAPRDHRLDLIAKAANVVPSPAGLWHWGHETGIGLRRYKSDSELIELLLPKEEARVTRQGIKFFGAQYQSSEIDLAQWTGEARNFGSTSLPISYFPGSLNKIWTPNLSAPGQMEFELSDYSRITPGATVEEAMDAIEYARGRTPDSEHSNNLIALDFLRKNDLLVKRAQQATTEASEKDRGAKPTIREARRMEVSHGAAAQAQLNASSPQPPQDEARQSYAELLHSIFEAANIDGEAL